MKLRLLTLLIFFGIYTNGLVAQSAEINGDFETFIDLTPVYNEAFELNSPANTHLTPDGYISLTRFTLLVFEYVIFGVLPTGDELERFTDGAVGLQMVSPGANGSNTAVGLVPDEFFNGADMFGAFANSMTPNTFSGYYKYEGNGAIGDTLFALSMLSTNTFVPQDIADLSLATAYTIDTLYSNNGTFEFFESSYINVPGNSGTDTVTIFFLALFDSTNVANGNLNSFVIDQIGFDQNTMMPCEQDGGVVSYPDGSETMTICVGAGMSGPVDIIVSGSMGDNFTWVVTDQNGIITSLANSSPLNFDGAVNGTFLIWYLAYEDGLTGAEIGMNINALDGCFDLSNSVTLVKSEVEGGDISFGQGRETASICVGDGIPDPLDVTLTGASGKNSTWLIVDGNGVIITNLASPPFDLEDAGEGVCFIFHISYEDGLIGAEAGMNVSDLEGCFDISNTLTVTRVMTDGGTIALEDGTDAVTLCAGDGQADPLNVSSTGGSASNMAWVITDENGLILELPSEPPFDFDDAGAGVCLIWNLAFENGLVGAEVGMNTNDLAGCFSLSNPITVTRNQPLGGELLFEDGEEMVTICVGDGSDDILNVNLENSVGPNKAWVITDEAGVILELPAGPPFNFEGAEVGTCLLWHLSFENGLIGAEVGMNANDLMGCFSLSNALTVERVDSGPSCLIATSDLPLGIYSINVFPNPAQSNLYVNIEGDDVKTERIYVRNINGQDFYPSAQVKDGIISLEVEDLLTGLYVLTIQTNKGMIHSTFVK